MSYFHSAIIFLAVASICTVVTGCAPEWKESKIYPSPDEKYVVVVDAEVQAANDPEPMWQHISIYRKGDEKQNQKGNLFVYSSMTPPTIKWMGPRGLRIDIEDLSYSFTGPIDSTISREVSITTTLHQPQRKNG